MRSIVLTALTLWLATTVVAVEIPFKDGSVVEADAYTVTGSYVMIEMPGGGKVAYDVADIDLEALQAAAAPAAADDAAAAESGPVSLGRAGSLALPGDEPSGGIAITDHHVKHVRGSGIAGPEDEAEEEAPAAEGGVPEGYEEGGGVLLNNLNVTPVQDGSFAVSGEVVNRSSDPVMDVQVNISVNTPEGEELTSTVGASALLGPDEKASFSQSFAAPAGVEDGWAPAPSVNVVYMTGENRLEPNFNRTAPHPSALPMERGGVTGVETRGEVEL